MHVRVYSYKYVDLYLCVDVTLMPILIYVSRYTPVLNACLHLRLQLQLILDEHTRPYTHGHDC